MKSGGSDDGKKPKGIEGKNELMVFCFKLGSFFVWMKIEKRERRR